MIQETYEIVEAIEQDILGRQRYDDWAVDYQALSALLDSVLENVQRLKQLLSDANTAATFSPS
jgi:hypothetical protein